MPMLLALMGDNMRLKGKVALLTGAAAAIKGELMGFGGAVAHLFVREGAKVVLTDIRDDLGERAAAALRADGHDARYMHLDVTSEENWANVVDAVMDTHGRLDILFNNAGVDFPERSRISRSLFGSANSTCTRRVYSLARGQRSRPCARAVEVRSLIPLP